MGGQKTAEMGSIRENFKNLSSQHMQVPGDTRHSILTVGCYPESKFIIINITTHFGNFTANQ